MKEKRKMLLSELNENISRIDSKLPYIELGGCGIFSYLLHNKLKDKYGIESEIVYQYGLHENCEIQFSHILIKIDDKVIDNKGMYEYHEGYRHLTIDKLEELVNRKDIWNNKFHTGWTCSSTFKWVDPNDKLKELLELYL
jgi:hypothetical protein